MSSKFLSEVVDTFFQKRLKAVIWEYEKDPESNFNPNRDYNKILLQIKIKEALKIIRLATLILLCSYFLGILWYIFCEIEWKNHISFGVELEETFFDKYKMHLKTNM